MKILADFHHPDLYESYLLTLQDRLGYDVYRMIGDQWFTKNYWTFEKSWAGDKYAKMFLPLDENDRIVGDHYERDDPRHPGRTFKMLTLDQAREMRIDYVLTSVTNNHQSFQNFVNEINSKHIIQVGNNEHYVNWQPGMLGLISTSAVVPSSIRYVRYSPEFDVQNLFYHSPVPVDGPVGSFILVWHGDRPQTLGLLNYVADSIPERPFYVYGEEGQVLETDPLVAERMQEVAAFWHTKAVGDGYGFVIHQSASIGRPLIGMRHYYHGARASFLWDPKSSLDLDSMKPETAAAEVKALLDDPDRLISMGEHAYSLFQSRVNFDEDAENIRKLLER